MVKNSVKSMLKFSSNLCLRYGLNEHEFVVDKYTWKIFIMIEYWVNFMGD